VPVVGHTAVAVGGLADSGFMVRITRGRLWIGVLACLLTGIVGLNVFALSFSARSSEAARQAETLEQRNSALRAQLAKQLTTEEQRVAATRLGLLTPAPGDIAYLKPSADDAATAAQRLRSGELTTADGAPAVATPVATEPVEGAATTETAATDQAAAAPETTAEATTAPATTETATPATDAAAGGVAIP